LQIASFSTEAGRQFSLVRHQHQPLPGTDILTHEKSTTLTEDLLDALSALRLKSDDLIWKHPDIDAASLSEGAAPVPAAISLRKLYDLENDLRHDLESLHAFTAPSLVIGFLTNAGAYVSTHLSRLREWGSRSQVGDLDLIGYSTWCIFEVDCMLQYDLDDQRASAKSVLSNRSLGSCLYDFQSRFDSPLTTFDQQLLEYSKQLWQHETPSKEEIIARIPLDEYQYLQSLYEKYSRAASYVLIPPRSVESPYIRDVFLDRAVRLAQRCVFVINVFVRSVSKTSNPKA
jgi:hypothetical protein